MAKSKGNVSPKFKEQFYKGAQFGDWVIISEDLIYKGKQNHIKLQVKCKCGVENLVDPYTLKKGLSTCCFKCGHSKKGKKHPSWKGYKEIPGSWFRRYLGRSEKFEFKIKIQDVYNLWLKQNKKCALTGLDINFINLNEKTHDLICTASLDRIDSKKGYIKDNIQLVHKDINMMKKEYNQDYFIKMCKLVCQNH